MRWHYRDRAHSLSLGGMLFILLSLISACGGGGGGSSSSSAPPPGPSTTVHLENWDLDHGPVFTARSGECLPCHGNDLRGGTSQVSCFLGSYFTGYCHTNGPPKPPHARPLASAALHGTSAKQNLAFTVSRIPETISFNGGSSIVACDTCHSAAKAHPTNWQGAGSYSHRTSGTRDGSCAICHNTLDATSFGPDPRSPSCFSASFRNAAGQTQACHSAGPGTTSPHPIPYTDPARHGISGTADLNFCQTCHGTPGTSQFDGGLTTTACSTCHIQAEAHPTDWQGSGLYTHRTSGNRNASKTTSDGQ
jgi:hypothetical protein